MRLTVYGRYTDFGLMSLGLNVRFGSKADIPASQSDVRFTPESGHSGARSKCPLSAISGHPCD